MLVRRKRERSDYQGNVQMTPSNSPKQDAQPSKQAGVESDFFPALESLRGLAALGVTLFHVHWTYSLKDWGLAANSWMFVDLFFVLSGFVIAHTYRHGLEGKGALQAFGVRRLFRLYPLHLTTLGVFVATHVVFVFVLGRGPADSGFTAANEPFAQQLTAHLLMLHAAGATPNTGFNAPSWSISAEAFAYCVFALLAISPLWRRGRRAAFAVLAAVGLGMLLLISPNDSLFSTYDAGIWRALYGFSLGVIAQASLAPVRKALGAGGGVAGLAQAASLFAALVFISVFDLNSPVTLAAPFVFVALVLAFAAAPTAAPARALSHPWLVGLGTISYSIYMVHFAIALGMKEVMARMPGAIDVGVADVQVAAWIGNLGVLAYWALVIIASLITYRLIEAPARDWGRALAKARPSAKAKA
jgi:peptidoglycan/LPS O-acetylase OafA/YrhL